MNGKWWVGVSMLGLVACGPPPPSRDCTEDRQCYADEYCDLSVMLCTNFSDAGIDGGRRDGGAIDSGTPDGGRADGGHADGGADGGVDAGCLPTEVCRYAVGPCDLAELCTAAGECPRDLFEMNTTMCRAADSGVACDAPEYCTGSSPQCPADLPAAASVPCRASAGMCDLEESCDGVSFECPVDVKAASTTPCRGAVDVCDAPEFCTGSSDDCPPDLMLSAATVCRGDAGVCDVAEHCTGTSAQCPPDTLVGAGVTCRAAVDLCDVAETCTGASINCPGDSFAPSTQTCRPDAGVCDIAEKCTGAGPSCPSDMFQSSSVTCGAQTCSAGQVTPAPLCAGTMNACNPPGSNISCNGYACNGAACRTTCSINSDCITSTHFCDVSTCTAKWPDGHICTSGATGYQCSSGSCVQVYPDGDQDGYGAGSAVFHCGGATTGFAANNTDCCDTDANAKPGQTGWFTTARTGCGGYDYDCSGGETLQYPAGVGCSYTGSCDTAMCSWEGGDPAPGWKTPPACGGSGTWYTSCSLNHLGGGCFGGTTCTGGASSSRTQGCH